MKITSAKNCLNQQSFGFRNIKLKGITYQNILGECPKEDWLKFKNTMQAICPRGIDVAVTVRLMSKGSNVLLLTSKIEYSERLLEVPVIWKKESVELTKENILNGLIELRDTISNKRELI